jgi:uncharacterized damage-inducible protein DinB
MNTTDLLLLFEYNRWANHRVLESVAGLSPEQFLRDLHNSFPSVRDTLCHIMAVEWIWTARCRGNAPPTLWKAAEFPVFAALRVRWNEVECEQADFLSGLRDGQLTALVNYRDTSAGDRVLPLWQALQHLVNHSTYHRGQVTTMLRQLGATPQATDLALFYRIKSKQETA